MLKLLFIFAFTLSSLANPCLDAIESYFAKDIDQKTLDKFLKLQSTITLNRLAWANLKLSRANGQRQDLQKNILIALKEKKESPDPKLKEAIDFFEKQPLSRTALTKIMPLLNDVFESQLKLSNKDDVYKINSADIKMLELLAEGETKSTSELFDGKMTVKRKTASQVNSSILNMTKIINSSHRSLTLTGNNLQNNIALAQNEIVKNENELLNLLNSIPLPSACDNYSQDVCGADNKNLGDLYTNFEDIQIAIQKGLLSRLKNKTDTDFYKNLRYGDLWLKVKKGDQLISIKDITPNRIILEMSSQTISSSAPIIREVAPEIIDPRPIVIPKPNLVRIPQATSTPEVSNQETLVQASSTPSPLGIEPQPSGFNLNSDTMEIKDGSEKLGPISYYISGYEKYYQIKDSPLMLIKNKDFSDPGEISSRFHGSHAIAYKDSTSSPARYVYLKKHINDSTENTSIHKSSHESLCELDFECQKYLTSYKNTISQTNLNDIKSEYKKILYDQFQFESHRSQIDTYPQGKEFTTKISELLKNDNSDPLVILKNNFPSYVEDDFSSMYKKIREIAQNKYSDTKEQKSYEDYLFKQATYYQNLKFNITAQNDQNIEKALRLKCAESTTPECKNVNKINSFYKYYDTLLIELDNDTFHKHF